VGLNEKGYISYVNLSMYSLEEAKKFKGKYEKYLDAYQKKELKNIIGMSEVYNKVEYSFHARKYRHIVTGEITTQVDIMKMNEYEEVNDDKEIITPIDEEKEQKKKDDINRRINKAAVINASRKTSLKDAMDTFKRVR